MAGSALAWKPVDKGGGLWSVQTSKLAEGMDVLSSSEGYIENAI